MAGELTHFSLSVAGAVRAELARRNLSGEALVPVLSIGRNAVYARLRGERSFEVEEVAKIASFLGVQISALVVPTEALAAAS